MERKVVQELLIKTAGELRTLGRKCVDLEKELSEYKRKEDTEKVAMELVQKGFADGATVKEKAERMIKDNVDPEKIRTALQYADSEKVASIWAGADDSKSSSGKDVLTSFLLDELE